jgi:hypothetical protein
MTAHRRSAASRAQGWGAVVRTGVPACKGHKMQGMRVDAVELIYAGIVEICIAECTTLHHG